jgi:lipopolysaccharide transport system ATP-binding protein
MGSQMYSEADPVRNCQSADAKSDPAQSYAIRISAVSKCFRIYDRPQDRLKQSLVARFARLVGREDRRYFREFWAVRDVSLDVRRGETLGIIGRNGSGKSTLLQMICGTLTPSAGSIEVYGRVAALLELGSGFNPEFTGRENVHLNAMVLGLTQAQVDERFDAIVEFADIGEFIDQPVKTYSSGMYVRLAFAVIAHVDADILVIDEALSVGDVFFTQKCMRFLRKFQETGTVVFVSHDAAAVTNLCNRAALLDSGRLAMVGDAKSVCEAYHASGYEQSLRPARKTAAPSEKTVAPKVVKPKITPVSEMNVFRFDPERSRFGSGAATIAGAALADSEGHPLFRIVGGEAVRLVVEVDIHARLHSPIVGFMLKDRLGQALFGDNTYLAYERDPVPVEPGDRICAEFEFVMPILQQGHYSVDLAVADGTYLEHEQADWLHDGLIIESHTSSVSTGLVGIPFQNIRLFRGRRTT